MENYPGQYTVIRYIPDPIKNEARNIGIILQCENLGYINSKFIKNYKLKLGGSALKSDINILKRYAEDFATKFREFSKGNKPSALAQVSDFFKKDYLKTFSSNQIGKIQYSEPRGCLISNPDNELNSLFNLIVNVKEEYHTNKYRGSRIKTKVRNDFKKHNLLYSEPIKKRREIPGFKVDQVIKLRDDIKRPFDFSFNNGKLHLVETVDMTLQNSQIWELKTYEAAYMIETLRNYIGKNRVETYSAVNFPENGYGKHLLEILKSESNVINYSNPSERNKFLILMNEIVDQEPNLLNN